MPGETTPLLDLPLLAAAQAQKHVTHNEALLRLDALTHLSCLSRVRAAPPPEPEEGDRFLLAGPDAPTGAWAGWAGRIALFRDGAWCPLDPRPGWLAWVADEDALFVRIGTGWRPYAETIAALADLDRLGIGTEADAANPFAAKLNKALWTARGTTEGGDGSLLYTLNKEAPGRDLGLLFQTAYGLRALLGLFGDDDLTIRTSPDGASFREALRIEAATGLVRLPRLPRFCAALNYDAYLPAEAWTAVPLNEAAFNDQNAFAAATGLFTAPAAGTYAFGAALGWKPNGTNQPSALLARLVRNGATPLPPGPHRAAPLVAGSVALGFSSLVSLAAGDTIGLQARFAGLDGYLAKTDTRLWGHLVG